MGITVERLTLELVRVFEPLHARLAAGELQLFFAELGLPPPGAVLTSQSVVASIGAARTELVALPGVVDALTAAIEADDVPGIIDALADAKPVVDAVFDAVDAIGIAVHAAASGAAAAEVQVFAGQLPERLLAYLVVGYLDRWHPVAHGVAELLGLVESSPEAATATAPAHVRRMLHLDRLGPLAKTPMTELGALYGWGTSQFKWDTLLSRLARFAGRVSSFAFVQPGPPGKPPVLRIAFVDIGPTEDSPQGLRATVRAKIDHPLDVNVPISDTVAVELAVATAVEAEAAVELLPPAELRVVPPQAQVSGQARLGLAVTGPGGNPVLLLGTAAGPRLEAKTLRLAAGADLTWGGGRAEGDLVVEGAIEDGRVVLTLDGADGFLKAILPQDGVSVDFDVLAGWSDARGVYFEGGAALAIDVSVDVDLGPVKIQMLHLALRLDDDRLSLETSAAISAKLGPFAMAVDRMGTIVALTFPAGGGNLGPADLAVEFKPPSGIGLSIDAGVVKGGGYVYLDPDAGEYAGLLDLSVGPVSIKALGILSTKLPDGGEGWALLLLVFGEFPPVQLGYGFALTGVGGIIGLQHGVDTAALQSGLSTGVLDSVLFPVNPVANAPTLIRQLRVAFPFRRRALTIGPALKIGWSTPPMITLSVALVLQFDDVLGAGPGQPALSRIVLLGRLKVQIPPGPDSAALIHLQIDILGSYDFDEKALSIDAVLRDSHIAGLPVTGSMVVRARFGANPTFLMAVGGFHPRFTDLPPGIPPQTRVGIELRYGGVVVRIVGYFAVTSNTVQVGAEAQLVAEGGSFRVEAMLGFDAMFVFQPRFSFEIDFRLGASIRYKKISLAAVLVAGRLTGPGRWEISGHATITVLGFDIGIDFSEAWGAAPAEALPSIAVGVKLAEALASSSSWTAQLPAGGHALVTLRRVAETSDVLAHPLGELVAMQKVVPLGVKIDRVGRSRPSDGNRFDITGVQIGGVSTTPAFREEHFARGEFLDLSEADKLSKPSFERFRAGVAVSSSDYRVAGSQITFDPEWETVFLGASTPSVRGRLNAAHLVVHAGLGAVAHTELRADADLLPATMTPVSVSEPGYAVAGAGVSGPSTTSSGMTFTEASQQQTSHAALILETAELASR